MKWIEIHVYEYIAISFIKTENKYTSVNSRRQNGKRQPITSPPSPSPWPCHPPATETPPRPVPAGPLRSWPQNASCSRIPPRASCATHSNTQQHIETNCPRSFHFPRACLCERERETVKASMCARARLLSMSFEHCILSFSLSLFHTHTHTHTDTHAYCKSFKFQHFKVYVEKADNDRRLASCVL